MGGSILRYRRVLTVLAALLATAVFSSASWAQTAVFTGRVTSAAGQPLGGASVGIPDLGVGGIADANGQYTFTIDLGGRTGRTANVVARFIGYKPKLLPVTLSAGRVQHDFALERDVLNLEEVIVTGTSEATSQKKATFSVGVVDNTQLKEVPAASALGGIEGKVAGASLVSSSGAPGQAPSIRLRSATSLTGREDPLYIIDGTIVRTDPGGQGLTLADINSEDIERIEIIKGAAASSLYGSDAANGVVQIFTKRGGSLAEGQTNFTFRNEYGQNYLPNVLEGNMHHNYAMNCDDDGNATTPMVACTEAELNDASVAKSFVNGADPGDPPTRTSDTDLIADNPYPAYYDQLRKIFKTGQFFTNYASVGQRRGSTNFNVSFQNQHDGGVVRYLNGFQRENFRLNVDQALTEKIDLGMGAFYGRSVAEQPDDLGFLFGLRFIEPNVQLDSIVADCNSDASDTTAAGAQIIETGCSYFGQFNPAIKQAPLSGNLNNPLYENTQRQTSNGRDRFTGTFKAIYRPLTWLTADANIGYDQASRNYKFYTPFGFANSAGVEGSGDIYHRDDSDRAYNTNLGLTSVRSFWNDQIRNTSKAAYLYEDQTNQSFAAQAYALTVRTVPEFGADDENNVITTGSNTDVTRAQNVFFISTFDIKDRYILDGLIRRDQSSLFGAHERTAIYHRLSAAWRVTEDYQIPGVDELKLRISHGTAGLRPTYEAQYETFNVLGGLPSPQNKGNADLRPAFSSETEYGFNASFLRNYSLEYSYSKKHTSDQIMKVPLAGKLLFQTQWQNAGTLDGSTHELSLGAVLLSKADYFWRLNITGDRTRQNITALSVPAFLVGPSDGTTTTQIFRIAAGQPFGVIYGNQWVRTQQQLQETIDAGKLGTTTVADYTLNEEGFYVPTANYHTIAEAPIKHWVCADGTVGCAAPTSTFQIGDVNPDFNMGFNTNAQWKGVSLNGTVSWVKGGNIYNLTRQWPFNELRDPVIDQSAKPNVDCTGTTDPAHCAYSTGKKPTTYYSTFYNNIDANDYFVEDGSYLRLRELALNYALPAKWVSRIPGADFRSARIGVVGRNLWTHTNYSGYDPDVTGPGGGNPFAYRVDYFTYPPYRTYTAMLELGF
jgi:TonB-linked SusC/RagA family outer membrane protein